MKTINKRFIDIALNIRKKYLTNIKMMDNYENDIKEINDDLMKTYNNIQKINSIDNINKKDMEEHLFKLNEKVNKLKSNIDIILQKNKKLEKESDILYENIISNYPNINNNDIQNIIQPHINKLDEKN